MLVTYTQENGMAIVPSGKKRIMEAQSSLQADSQWGLGQEFGGAPVEQPQQGANANVQQEQAPLKEENVQGVQGVQEEKGEDGKPDILEYIYKVLEKLGYPPRRLEEFSDEFIEEEMFPGGIKDITVTLPDRYYGQKKRISDKDLSNIMNQIQKQFGLTLTQATRKEKKAIMNFTSQPQEQEEVEVPGDDLDEIFGTQKGAENNKAKAATSPKNNLKTLKNPKRKKEAQTIHELVKENHSNLMEKLLKVLEDK